MKINGKAFRKKVFKSRPTPVEAAPNAGKGLIKGKLGSIIGKVGGIAARWGNLIPGIGGIVSTVGKVAESVNDPWWWENVKGCDGVSTNVPLMPREAAIDPLRAVKTLRPGVLEFTAASSALHGTVTNAATALEAVTPTQPLRWALSGNLLAGVIRPTDSQVSSYLMQNVRKVVNAIPLQSPNAYREVFINSATAYAMRKCLDKFIYLAKHGQVYLPAMTDGSYPILAPENFAILTGLRDRLGDYLSASVRLPHTLCQYLSWRFGRVYRTGASAKSAIVLYNVLPLNATVADYSSYVEKLIGFAASDTSYYRTPAEAVSAKTAALADLYNAYLKHTQDVPVMDDTQFHYDPKEFVLRTNLDLYGPETSSNPNPDYIYMDSDLDNKTTFIASTVSTVGAFNGTDGDVLFPVSGAYAHFSTKPGFLGYATDSESDPGAYFDGVYFASPSGTTGSWWLMIIRDFTGSLQNAFPITDEALLKMAVAAVCKSLEYYNVEIYGMTFTQDLVDRNTTSVAFAVEANDLKLLDLTAMSQDLALVSNEIINNTHTYAFANLVCDDVTSYAASETPTAIKEAQSVADQVVDELTK